MTKRTGIAIVTMLTFLLAGCGVKNVHSSCPDIQGSYQIENSANLYIKKNPAGDYLAMIATDDSPTFLPVITVDKDKLERENLPECSVILKGAGVLIPSDKDKTYNVTSLSQNYTSERKPGTPFVLMVMAGFQSNVYGVVKTSATLPTEISENLSKGNVQ